MGDCSLRALSIVGDSINTKVIRKFKKGLNSTVKAIIV